MNLISSIVTVCKASNPECLYVDLYVMLYLKHWLKYTYCILQTRYFQRLLLMHDNTVLLAVKADHTLRYISIYNSKTAKQRFYLTFSGVTIS